MRRGRSFVREIPGILNRCAHCEPIARPVDFLCRFPLVIFQQAAQSFPAPHRSLFPSCLGLKRKQYAIFLALMVPLFMVMQQILLQGSPQQGLSDRMSFARHSSLTDLTQRSAYEFKFGLLAGKRSGSTFPDPISSRKDSQNFVSRSCSK